MKKTIPLRTVLVAQDFMNGDAEDAHVKELYGVVDHSLLNELVLGDPATHSMGASLDAYVRARVDSHVLDAAVAGGLPISVQGIYPSHADQLFPELSYLSADDRPTTKWGNGLRPTYAHSPASAPNGGIVVFVPPGRDYVRHNAELIGTYIRSKGASVANVAYYPSAEARLPDWIGLRSLILDDVVVLGYAEQLVRLFIGMGAVVVEEIENEYLRCVRLEVAPSLAVTFMIVRFSFWGSTARILGEALADGGARYVLYAGKLGTLDWSDEPYERIYVPSAYARSATNGSFQFIEALDNPLLNFAPALNSGTHLSVETMMTETRLLVSEARSSAIHTIDNEIAEFASGILGSVKSCGFSAIHFATDSPRSAENPNVGRSDLTTARGLRERRARSLMLREIAMILRENFQQL